MDKFQVWQVEKLAGQIFEWTIAKLRDVVCYSENLIFHLQNDKNDKFFKFTIKISGMSYHYHERCFEKV